MIDLREKVAREIWETWRGSAVATDDVRDVTWEMLRSSERPKIRALVELAQQEADAAIAVVLEEAAKMVERLADDGVKSGSWDNGIDNWAAAQIIAAGIRALGGKNADEA